MSNLTNVHLLNVPIESDYKNTLYFGSKDAQTNYFSNRVVHSCADASYLRKEGVFKIDKHVDSLYNCNYIMYQNSAFTNKWFYGFITDLEYKNPQTTFVHFEIDVMQTWMFDYTVKPSFIEREHVDVDTIGFHTVPENLELGEFVANEMVVNEKLKNTSMILSVTLDINSYEYQADSWNLTKEFKPAHGQMYDGLYSGLKYFQITESDLQTILKHLTYEGQEDAINSIFMAPTQMLRLETKGKYACEVKRNTSPVADEWTCGYMPETINGYAPRNNKLFTAPFCYMVLDNNGGGAVTYQYEKFSIGTIKFKIYSTITPGMSIRAVPQNYNGVSENHSEGLNLSKYATCSWNSDAFTSWLAQNAINIGVTGVMGLASTAVGIAGAIAAPATAGGSLAVAGAIVGGVGAIGSQVASVAQHSQVPPQIHGNTNGGDVTTAMNNVTFRLYKMSIKREYAKIIDGFFDMFGYKVTTVKTPNKNHRKNYWYTKTIDVNIDGAIPNKDLQQIKNCYNAGITFWRSGSDVGNYSVDNSIT